MSAALYNLAAMTVGSTGAGTITLGAAATILGVKYLSFAQAGVPDGALVYYSINDVGASEVGGPSVYTAAGTTLARNPINSTNGGAAINMTASAIVRITPVASQSREVLTANRTYFVRPDGVDTNTGFANTAAGAFLTIQKALNTITSLDIGIFNVLIQVADGAYPVAIMVNGPWLGSGVVTLQGNTTTPANVTISSTVASAVTVQNGGSLTIKGFKVSTTASFSSGLYATTGGSITFDRMDFGAANRQIQAGANSFIFGTGSAYTISAGGGAHWACNTSAVIQIEGATITLTGTPAFTTGFAWCNLCGIAVVDNNTFVGAATGPRYLSDTNAVIGTFGGGATYLPGNAAGSVSNGGVYT